MSHKRNKVGDSYIERACGAASSLGSVVGRAVNWFSASHRIRVGGPQNYDNAEREGRIISRLYKVKKRLHRIEKDLQYSNTSPIGESFETFDENDYGSVRKTEPGRAYSVVQGLNHPDPAVRAAAVARSIQSGTFSQVYFLILLLDDPVPEIRKQAWIAMRKITGVDFEFDPEEDETIRATKVEVLKRWWKEEQTNKL